MTDNLLFPELNKIRNIKYPENRHIKELLSKIKINEKITYSYYCFFMDQ